MTRTHALLALAVLSLAAARPARAQGVYYPSNATITTTINNFVYVGYANAADRASAANGTSPTVTLAPGGSIPSNPGTASGTLRAYNHSTVNITGGSIGNALIANDASTVNVTAGSVNMLTANGSATVVVTGGVFTGGPAFLDNTLGTFTFIGTGLTAVPLGPDTLYGLGGADYALSGTLQDGHRLTGDTINVQPGAAMFTLLNAPEPSQPALLALGFLVLSALHVRARKRTANPA